MKKIILASTALVGLAAFAQPSFAADTPVGKMQLTLGGYVDVSAGFFGTKATKETNRDFRNTTQVQVEGTVTTDNGLTYGPHIEIREQSGGGTNGGSGTSPLRFAQNYLFVSGNFGRFELGDRRGPSYLSSVYAPTVGFGQVDSDYDSYYIQAITNQVGSADISYLRPFNSNRATKVVYYTPTFAGFQAGVSYAPELNKGDSAVVQNAQRANVFGDNGRYSDFFEGALTYKNTFNGVGLSGSFTATHAQGYGGNGFVSGAKVDEVTAYYAGAQIAYAGFTLGGGWVNQGGAALGLASYNGASLANGAALANAVPGGSTLPYWRAKQGYNVGATYQSGPAGVGVSYGSQDTNLGTVNTLGAGLTYAVAPGLTVSGDYYYVENNAVRTGTTGTDKDRGNFFILSTRVDF